MFDPIELSKKTEETVIAGDKRKYYRFRATKFYGGIATADSIGCNIRCVFCWSGNIVWNSETVGQFYTPNQAAESLYRIARENGYTKVRISGGEPTIGKDHLLSVINQLDADLVFILETNGILLGYDKTYVQDLSRFKNLHVRVCLKGTNAKEFSWLTGAIRGFEYQLKALEYLRDSGLSFNIAAVTVTSEKKELFDTLHEMGIRGIMIEEEEIRLYPPVKKRLKKTGMLEYFLP